MTVPAGFTRSVSEGAQQVNVLVVEDNPETRLLLTAYLTKRCLAVTPAADGQTAIKTLERGRGRFDLVVTDLNMPGADGFAVLGEARRTNPRCAVVIITGYATLDAAIQAVRVGAYDFLQKPFSLQDMDRLLARIATDMRWQSPVQPAQLVVVEAPTPPPATLDALTDRIRILEARLEALGLSVFDGSATLE